MHIKIESTDEFFSRGKAIASLADKGLLKKESKIVSFEHAEDLAKVMTMMIAMRVIKADDTPVVITKKTEVDVG